MMHFTVSEIFSSVLFAFIFGAGCAFLYMLALSIFDQLAYILLFPKYIFCYSEKILSIPPKTNSGRKEKGSPVLTFFSIIIFTLGFILLSYFALDGSIRLYMLVISLSSLFLVKKVLLSKIFSLLNISVYYLFSYIIIALRVVTYPFLRSFFYIKKKILKQKCVLSSNRADAVLDKRK